ncbi:MAG: sigma-54-dependent Fis family transcriptional regulator [Bacteroidales bacterium]|nr:sigma-54-dependent Fis family transcriptional regulator [Bacteroidales bacterium]
MLGDLLIIDDDNAVLESLELLLRSESKGVVTLSDPKRLNAVLESQSFDSVLLDMNFTAGRNTGNEGIFWLREILKSDPDLSVIMITAYGDVDLAVKAMKIGAFDYVQKPWKSEKLISSLNAACRLTSSRRKVKQLEVRKEVLQEDAARQYPGIIGQSLRIREVHQTISKVAKTDTTVLIQGENGTGKELIAWEIHRQSIRKGQLFVTVDLGSLSATLFESELFGHKKGAFTDAKNDRTGRFEAASGGTLFLDEIGNVPLHLQPKLLSVLQKGEIVPVGSHKAVPVDVRIVSATNQDIEQMVNKGLFREDLFYRINTIRIESPALRDRGEDIGVLAGHFLESFSRKYGKHNLRLSNKALEKLYRHPWPGNIRELQHAMENVVIMSETDTIQPEEITLSNHMRIDESSLNLEHVERNTIRKALTKYSGNYASIASELGISRTTLYHKIRKYGL